MAPKYFNTLLLHEAAYDCFCEQSTTEVMLCIFQGQKTKVNLAFTFSQNTCCYYTCLWDIVFGTKFLHNKKKVQSALRDYIERVYRGSILQLQRNIYPTVRIICQPLFFSINFVVVVFFLFLCLTQFEVGYRIYYFRHQMMLSGPSLSCNVWILLLTE